MALRPSRCVSILTALDKDSAARLIRPHEIYRLMREDAEFLCWLGADHPDNAAVRQRAFEHLRSNMARPR